MVRLHRNQPPNGRRGHGHAAIAAGGIHAMKPHFVTRLVMIPQFGGETWILDENLVYESADYGVIMVERDFVTDLASVPRLWWNILPPQSIAEEAVLHDWLYSNQDKHKLTRLKCDNLLLEAMIAQGQGWWKRQTIYRGVRLGGWLAWRNKRKTK
jgi:hypothetical protein